MSQGGMHVAVMEMASVDSGSAGPDAVTGSARESAASSAMGEGVCGNAATGPCPACGASGYHSLLSAPAAAGTRLLVSCTRCGLLRFLGTPPQFAGVCSLDRLLGYGSAQPASGRLFRFLHRAVIAGPARFVVNQGWKKRRPQLAIHADDTGAAFAREVQRDGTRSIFFTPDLPDATRALYRHGVAAVVADPSEPPIADGGADAVVCLRGFASQPDPAGWLCATTKTMQPGGRLYLQIYDCSSWAFLLCGSRWVGLEADSACYAYRVEDLEVLLGLCGLRIVRRSYYFPLLNALVWAASLLPHPDIPHPDIPHPDNGATQGENEQISGRWRTVGYLILACLLFPLALVESLCHTGSILMVEAELKS